MRVLVVDDQVVLVKALASVLRQWGFEVLECSDSADCLDMIERLRPDVVLLDLLMPQMSGFDIAAEMRRNPDLRPSRLIAVTGHDTPEHRQKTHALGFDFHLAKPIDLQMLRAALSDSEPDANGVA